VGGVAFSPDGKVLATVDSDGTVRLWDVATRSQISPPITIPASSGAGVDGVAFSPDGKVLATAGSDGTVRLWDVAFPGSLLNAVCAIAGRSLTRQEWSAYVQSEPFQQVCP
jgi:WD40 repeat protein